MLLKRILLVLGLAALGGAGLAIAASTTVSMTAGGPEPPLVTVAWGDKVTFANTDQKAHQISIPRVSLESPEIPPGGAFEYVFDGRRGNYGYRQTGGGPNKLGTIVVELKGSVTINASAMTVPWGRSLKLTGKSSFPGTPVIIADRVPGSGTNWAKIATTETAADGSFAVEIKPQRGAQYRAQVAADQIASPTVRVSVKPILTIRALKTRAKIGGIVTVNARVTPAHAATMLDLQHLDARHNRWLTALRKRTTKDGRVTFQYKALKGAKRLRIAARPLGLRVGWDEAASRAVTVTGVK
jgi:plastocyanin